ncbi:hypothetical protein LIER_15071 [Lithospermum erythrorhizon]|uniref:Uncharacterized protein n=1 Tax=Lithospermum erythrorhizon TaxID=34254 RepID=A0AAV3Q1W4_LITER
MANENIGNSGAGAQGNPRSKVIQGVLNEVRLARLIASMGGSYILGGRVPFSRTSSPRVHHSHRRVVVVPDPSDRNVGVQGLIYGGVPTPKAGGRDIEDVEVFATSVNNNPNTDVTGVSGERHVEAETIQMFKKRKRATAKRGREELQESLFCGGD